MRKIIVAFVVLLFTAEFLQAGIGVGISTKGALPVELTSFSASIQNNLILLNWSTATEVNNYGFEIERAPSSLNMNNLRGQGSHLRNSDFEGYSTIGFVQGHGNSNSPKNYTFTDLHPLNYSAFYRLKQIDTDGAFEFSHIIEVTANFSNKLIMKQNYPNPFNPTTIIEYNIPAVETGYLTPVKQVIPFVQLRIYDILGREVALLVNKKQEPGRYKINFNAAKLSGGVYFYKITSGNFTATKKMLLIK